MYKERLEASNCWKVLLNSVLALLTSTHCTQISKPLEIPHPLPLFMAHTHTHTQTINRIN